MGALFALVVGAAVVGGAVVGLAWHRPWGLLLSAAGIVVAVVVPLLV